MSSQSGPRGDATGVDGANAHPGCSSPQGGQLLSVMTPWHYPTRSASTSDGCHQTSTPRSPASGRWVAVLSTNCPLVCVMYDPIMKVRKTLSLDADVIEAFEAEDPESLSSAVNDALREVVRRRLRRANLAELVAELEAQYGPADPAQVAEFEELLR